MKTCLMCDKFVVARGLCHNHYMQKRRAGELLPKPKESDTEYIMARVVVDNEGHWRWQASKHMGYGRLVRGGKNHPAHAFSYSAFKGVPPAGTQINHVCHERDCVNPDHLYAGTQKENMRDMRDAGRSNTLRGSANGKAKLTECQVQEILRTQGEALPIAKKFGVSRSLIYAIRKGACWRQIRAQQE